MTEVEDSPSEWSPVYTTAIFAAAQVTSLTACDAFEPAERNPKFNRNRERNDCGWDWINNPTAARGYANNGRTKRRGIRPEGPRRLSLVLHLVGGVEDREHGGRASTEELLCVGLHLFCSPEKKKSRLTFGVTRPPQKLGILTPFCAWPARVMSSAAGARGVRPVRVLEEAQEQAGDLPGETAKQESITAVCRWW